MAAAEITKPFTGVSPAQLERQFKESEWCHIYRAGSYDLAICGAVIYMHEGVPYKKGSTVCSHCGRRICVDCLRVV